MDDQEYWDIEFKTTGDFLNHCPSDVRAHAIFQIVIYYTYSPLEEIDMRCKMLATTDIIRDVGYIYYVLGYPKLQDSPLLKSFLEKLKKDFSRVLNADMRKLAGAEG